MASKKRKTLPSNFNEILQHGSLEEQKAVFDTCELHAYTRGYSKDTALHNYYINEQLVHYLVEQGADLQIANAYGSCPLHTHCAYGTKIVAVLLELGADLEVVDHSGNTPLFQALANHRLTSTKLLLEHGANINALNQSKLNALEYGLSLCSNIDIVNMASIAKLMLDAGLKISTPMQRSVSLIGEHFERYRKDFNKDYLEATDQALNELYVLFDVSPAPKKVIVDELVPDSSPQEQFNYLWEILVPNRGAAKTIQGEVIRIAGRIRHEFYQNGGANWDRQYRSMLRALIKYLSSLNSLDNHQIQRASIISSTIKAHGNFDYQLLDELCLLALMWVKNNPCPSELTKTTYQL